MKFSSLFASAAFANGRYLLGSCTASSCGEEEEETFVSLTLQEPLGWDLSCFLLHEEEAFVSRN